MLVRMEITQLTLEKFRGWLLRRGRCEETARAYTSHLKKCAETSTLIDRLLDKKFSPKTRRANLAALSQWGKFSKDGDLLSELDEIRLPPAIRVAVKTELPMDEWRKILVDLLTPPEPQRWPGLKVKGRIDEPCRRVLLIVATRGLRIGDVLRLTPADVRMAVSTKMLSFEAKGARRIEYDATPIIEHLKALDKMSGWSVVRDLIGKKTSADRVINNKLRRCLRRVAKANHIKGVYPHRMRRTYATHYAEKLGNDPRALIKLAKHMGWTNINTAAQYIDNVNNTELDQLGIDLLADVMATKPAKRPKDPK